MVRFTNLFATGIAAVLALGPGAVLSGCKSDDAAPAKSSAQPAPAKEAAPAKAAPAKGVAPPAGHRMAKVKLGMSTNEVEEVMGSPSNSKAIASRHWRSASSRVAAPPPLMCNAGTR